MTPQIKAVMKTKSVGFILLVMSLVVWATWSYAYQRGYSQGSRDEFYCWKQVPQARHTVGYPDGVMTAHRKIWLYPGGKAVPAPRLVQPKTGAKNVITSFSISE